MSNIDKFLNTMKILRGKNGCPWDKEQTLKSLKPFLIEESYEVLDAIDRNNIEDHKEELGDVLLQIVFQAQIRAENGEFDFNDVVETINNKMIFRHPHVFSNDDSIKSSSDVLNAWDSFKEKEGKKVSFFKNIPKAYPALLESLYINQKVAKTGFDWPDKEAVFEKVEEEIKEFKEAKTFEEQEEEFGDILCVLVNLARKYNINPEEALKKSNEKLKNRFLKMTNLAKNRKLDFENLSLEKKDSLWKEIKGKN